MSFSIDAHSLKSHRSRRGSNESEPNRTVGELLLVQRRSLLRKLATRGHLQPIRIAVLDGSTTNEVVNVLDLWLLESGFSPTFLSRSTAAHVDARLYLRLISLLGPGVGKHFLIIARKTVGGATT